MKEKLTSRDIQARQTREKLLRTSMELIEAEGYRNVTIQRICKECGVSVGTFYQYFASKRDIIVLMGRSHCEYLSAACRMDRDRSARQLYTDFVERLMERVENSGPILVKSLMLGQLEGNVSYAESGTQLYWEFLGKVLAHGRETGEFSPDAITDKEFFDAFSIAINGVIVTWLLDQENIDLGSYGRRHLGRLLRLLEGAGK